MRRNEDGRPIPQFRTLDEVGAYIRATTAPALREMCPTCYSYGFIRGAGEQTCSRCGTVTTR